MRLANTVLPACFFADWGSTLKPRNAITFVGFRPRLYTMAQHERVVSYVSNGESLTLGMDPFCFRQFDDPNYVGTKIQMNKRTFMEQLGERLARDKPAMVEGYAPFCKHIFVENFTDANITTLPITEDNKRHIRTGYLARRPEELAVLCRWIPASAVQQQLTRAKYLDVILYAREQIAIENAVMAQKDEVVIDPAAPAWSIVAIKAQDESFEVPMNPITIMRNALIQEGGSGVPINREAYARSVDYWSKHILVQSDDAQV